MLNLDDATKENIKEHNTNSLQFPDHLCRLLRIGGCWSGKENPLFNLINQQPDINKFNYMLIPYESKYPFLIKKQKSLGLKHFNDSKSFMNTHMIWVIFIKILKI